MTFAGRLACHDVGYRLGEFSRDRAISHNVSILPVILRIVHEEETGELRSRGLSLRFRHRLCFREGGSEPQGLAKLLALPAQLAEGAHEFAFIRLCDAASQPAFRTGEPRDRRPEESLSSFVI